MGTSRLEGVEPVYFAGEAEMRSGSREELQRVEVGESESSAVSARKGTRHHGGVTMVSNDTIAIGKMMLLLSTANNPDSLIG